MERFNKVINGFIQDRIKANDTVAFSKCDNVIHMCKKDFNKSLNTNIEIDLNNGFVNFNMLSSPKQNEKFIKVETGKVLFVDIPNLINDIYNCLTEYNSKGYVVGGLICDLLNYMYEHHYNDTLVELRNGFISYCLNKEDLTLCINGTAREGGLYVENDNHDYFKIDPINSYIEFGNKTITNRIKLTTIKELISNMNKYRIKEPSVILHFQDYVNEVHKLKGDDYLNNIIGKGS